MALDVLTPDATVTEFELHVFELAYVMSLMGVEAVSGLPNAVLFPKDPQLRSKMLAEGERRLIANGWLTPVNGQGAVYNDKLLSMAAAVADPRLSILTRRESAEGERADATIYFNNVEVVEVTQIERQVFRLRDLKSAPEAFHRVRKILGVTPRSEYCNLAVEFRIEAFEKLRRHVAARELSEAIAELADAGFALDTAEDFATALSTPRRKGTVSVLKHISHKVTDVRVLGFYLGENGAWITSVVSESSNRVRAESVDTEGFIRRLVDRVAGINS
jgi:hypothetical protein